MANVSVSERGFSVIIKHDPCSIRAMCPKCRKPLLLEVIAQQVGMLNIIVTPCTDCYEPIERHQNGR